MSKTITMKTIWNEHTFEVTDKIPVNFFVWNIGGIDGHEEYIPICESLHPENKKCYDINTSTLKAIKLTKEEAGKLAEAAHYGINSLKTAEKALKSTRRGPLSDRKRKNAQITIEIFKKIS